MRIPQGWCVYPHDGSPKQHADPKYNHKDHFIRLKCILYGGKQAARNWFKHLTQGLHSEGFRQKFN